MYKCCVCGEYIDVESGDSLIYDEISGDPMHEGCGSSLEGYQIYSSLRAENQAATKV